jgi:serine/threonine-protein kinase
VTLSYAFGPFHLDVEHRRLLRDGQFLVLSPRAFDVLRTLVEHRGRVVEKGELLQAVWPDVSVEEGNLTQHVCTIRKVLGGDRESQYVATVPRRGYQFVADVQELAPAPARRPVPVPAVAVEGPAPRSIAVLPFVPLDADEPDQCLGFGMADALIMRLGNLRQAIVRPTSAVRRYVGVGVDPVEAARALRVELILEGSIQRSDDRIRVTVQLVDAREGSSLWGARFDERLTDIFAVQDAIAERLASALVPKLTPGERRRLTRRDTIDVEAHQACLRGRHYLARRTDEDLRTAVEQFERALVHDPAYALAYAGLSECQTILASAGYEAGAAAAMARARAAALRAVELDDELADAHVALGLVSFRLEWHWLEAEREFTRATNLNPGLATAYHFYALYLAAMGRTEEAQAAIARAQGLDPLSLIVCAAAGRVWHFARAYEEAVVRYHAALELDPRFADARMNLGLTYVELGRHDEAILEFRRAAELSGRRSLLRALEGYAYGVNGQADDAQRAVEDLQPLVERGELSAILLAYPCIGLGDADRAFEWLDRAVAERAGLLIYLKVEPMFDRLRGDPRMTGLMRRLQLAC